MEEKNLAAALKAIDDAYRRFPENPEVLKVHDEIFSYVTGQKGDVHNENN